MSGSERLRGLLRRIPASVRRDYAATLAVQWGTLAGGLFLFHLVAGRGGVDGFAYYQIARGVVSSCQPVVMLGLGQGLHRYLPRTHQRTETLARQAFLTQAGTALAIGLAGTAVAASLADLLGLDGGRPEVVAILILLAGNCLCTLTTAALRGTHQVTRSNIVAGIGLGAVPLLAFPFAARIDDFLILQGLGMGSVAVIGILTVRRRSPAPRIPGPEPTLRLLMGYGVKRLPGDLALPALFTLPTFAVATARPGAPEAGYVGFATSAVTLICSLFGTLTPVLLPRLSGLFHSPGDDASTHRMLTLLPVVAAALATGAAAVFGLFAPALVHGFLGPEFTAAIGVLRVGVLAAIPLAMFYAARPTLDALTDTPVISRLLCVCLVLQVVLTYAAMFFLPAPYAAVAAMCGAATVLGWRAERLVVRALRPADG
ncbi:lipopolysaccharide biosynthesis protein [Actinoplanes rectilineatus]|uniref:lipopolysaccharide biosynthesis protein n=1 Tax=Actinoplanes rectilineatus TaxID=113571 RepID=UPI0005F2E430|nr:hypothetical protein [Actinoplanes rectilineatus]